MTQEERLQQWYRATVANAECEATPAQILALLVKAVNEKLEEYEEQYQAIVGIAAADCSCGKPDCPVALSSKLAKMVGAILDIRRARMLGIDVDVVVKATPVEEFMK
jgi:hypothetical protein